MLNTPVLPPLSASMSIRNVRDLFEIPQDVTYLNCANMAPQLKLVTEAGVDAVHAKASPGSCPRRNGFPGRKRCDVWLHDCSALILME